MDLSHVLKCEVDCRGIDCLPIWKLSLFRVTYNDPSVCEVGSKKDEYKKRYEMNILLFYLHTTASTKKAILQTLCTAKFAGRLHRWHCVPDESCLLVAGVIVILLFLLQHYPFFVQIQRIYKPLQFGLTYIVCQLQVCIHLFEQAL